MSSIEAPERSETKPVPPRYWWLKRILVTAGVLSIVVVCGHWLWGVAAERNLQKKIAQLRAAGQPVLSEDFEQPGVPDEENAAYFVRRAAAQLVFGTQAGQMAFDDIGYDPRLVDEFPALADQAIAQNAASLAFIRQARLAPRCNWDVAPTVKDVNSSIGDFSNLRGCAKLAKAAAMLRHHRGDDKATIALLSDALSIAERTHQRGCLLSQLVGIAIDAMSATAIQYIAPHLNVEPSIKTPDSGAAASRHSVEHLMERLLDQEADSQAWRHAILTERALMLDSIRTVCDGTVGISTWMGPAPPPAPALLDRVARILFAPRWRSQVGAVLDELYRVAELGSRANWPLAKAVLPPEQRGRKTFFRDPIATLLHPLRENVFHNVYLQHIRSIAWKRMAAVALALRLYEIENGRRPASLQELVPTYLARIPEDPFAIDRRAIAYRPHADVPVLYCVGSNGVDENGAEQLDADGRYDWSKGDQRFLLNREDIPRNRGIFEPPKSKQAVEQQPGVENEGGEPDER